MRPSFCASFVSSILKLLIFFQAFVGVSIVIYSAWILDRWHRRGGGSLDDLPDPWFGYAMLGVGVAMCLMALIGHVAVEVFSGCFICLYVTFAISIMLLEAALVGFMALDKRWEEDLPKDPTGELGKLRAFIESNLDIFKWVGLAVVIIQALSLFFAIILRAILPLPHDEFGSDDELAVTNQYIQYAPNSALAYIDAWGSRMRQKYGLNNADYLTVPGGPEASTV